MMQSKAILLKLHGGSSNDIISWKKIGKTNLTKKQDVKN